MTPQQKEQLKARFFGMNIGCMISIPRYNEFGVKFRGVSNPVNESGFMLHCTRDSRHAFMAPISECKLILRPLSEMTDVEVLEAFNAAGIYGFDLVRDSDKIGVVGSNGVSAVIWIKTSPKPVGRFLDAWNNFPNKPQPECFEYMLVDWLRSKHFCLPFCGLDPIAEGWAILEEKIPANEATKAKKEKEI